MKVLDLEVEGALRSCTSRLPPPESLACERSVSFALCDFRTQYVDSSKARNQLPKINVFLNIEIFPNVMVYLVHASILESLISSC